MIKVGLTCGIGSGKSEVARLLAGHGAVIVDADALAREAVAPGTEGLARVAAEFGPGVLDADGALDRSKLAQIVFADSDRLAALNAIVHPYVSRRSQEIISAVPADAVVVYDVPLLVENHLESEYDLVVVVDAPVDVRLRRLVEQRGMDPADARSRMAAQALDDVRRASADVVLVNDGALEDLRSRVVRLWADRATWGATSSNRGHVP
jgi:dephospho-CoA kinase